MFIADDLYGSFEVTEPVLVEILHHPAMIRLKGISMGGYYPAEPQVANRDITRFDHSIGVFLLLRKYGASLEQQIAGIIHDVSHSAFSHTVDYFSNNAKDKGMSVQDSIHAGFVHDCGIADAIKKHGYDVNYILDDGNFPLKEKDMPDICADRIDYSLRIARSVFSEEESGSIAEILNGLVVDKDKGFVFNGFKEADAYARLFLRCNEEVWSSFPNSVMLFYTSKLFDRAIEKKIVSYEDFFKLRDNDILDKIEKSHDEDLIAILHCLDHPACAYKNMGKDDGKGYISVKTRLVDPLFKEGKGLVRVSERNCELQESLKHMPKFRDFYIAEKTALQR